MPDTIDGFPLNINDVVVYEQLNGELHLWRVRGLPGAWFPTKVAAEAAARRSFPTEDAFVINARITYRQFAQV